MIKDINKLIGDLSFNFPDPLKETHLHLRLMISSCMRCTRGNGKSLRSQEWPTTVVLIVHWGNIHHMNLCLKSFFSCAQNGCAFAWQTLRKRTGVLLHLHTTIKKKKKRKARLIDRCTFFYSGVSICYSFSNLMDCSSPIPNSVNSVQ